MTLAPIQYLAEHDVFGEQRWTGRAILPGVVNRDLLIVRVGDGLMGVRNNCPHRNIPILTARLDGADGILECPSHGWRMALTGGELLGRPVIERDGTYYLVVDDKP
jgi:nitrite reductase/ring-hydroxylating ferredoxin subunit